MEHNLVAKIIAEERYLRLEHGLQFGRCIDVQWCCTSEQAKGADQANETETMVAMDVADEDTLQLLKMHAGTTHLNLCALTTIHHEEFTTQLHQLAGAMMPQRRGRTAAPQDMNFECFHDRHGLFVVVISIAIVVGDAHKVFTHRRTTSVTVLIALRYDYHGVA